jgi:proteasome accessory factor A
MTVRRVMGLETEYGIAVPGQPQVNPMSAATRLVTAYAAARRVADRWDYEEERPLRDARGFDLSRELADPGLLTDEDAGMANLVLANGARFYVDHAHPEYSSPEVTGPLDAIRWDRAGEQVLADAAAAVQAAGGPLITLYKNTTDNKGASYGSHENYLMSRETPFSSIVTGLTPFLVTRQVFCGAGRVGLGQDGRTPGFQISQRADFIEAEVGLETTLKRPIINTRDEPHADAAVHRRLHVIIGDATLCDVATLLRTGTASLTLALIEAGWLDDRLTLADPVAEVRAVSRDPDLVHRLRLADGRRLTAVQVQREYCDLARKLVDDRGEADAETLLVLDRWEQVLDALDTDPMALTGQVDWIAKRAVLDGYRSRDDLDWSHARLAAVDLQWADLRPEKGIHRRLAAAGRIERLVTDAEVAAAVTAPPTDTRAYFRGRCVAKFGPAVTAASWDSVILDLPGAAALQRIPTLDPLRGTQAHVGALLDGCDTPADLLAAIRG